MDPFSIAAIVAAVVSTGLGVAGRVKQQKAEKEARAFQASMDKIKAQRERTQQIRQSLARRAEIIQAGENAGTSGSSAVIGGAQSAQATAFGNIQYINSQEAFGKAMSLTSERYAQGSGFITAGQAVGKLGSVAGAARDVFSGGLDPIDESVFVTPSRAGEMDKFNKSIFG